MKYDYMITATGIEDRDGVITALLTYAKMQNIQITSHKSFAEFLNSLPNNPIQGLAVAVRQAFRAWGDDGGDSSTAIDGESACTTDDPRELAQTIYDNIAGRHLISFEASALVMVIVSKAINEFQNDGSEEKE